MNSLDIVFGVLLLIFFLIGVWKGFFREVLGFTGVIGGVFLGIIGFGPAGKALGAILPGLPAFLLPLIGFLFIFIGFYLLCRILAGILSKLSQKMFLGWLNRLLGGLVGGLKGALLISLFLLLIGFFPFQSALQSVREDSLLYTPLQKLIPTLYNLGTNLSPSSRNFEEKITRTMQDMQVKLSEEMIKYLFYGKQDTLHHGK